jgi:DNA-directed RNA polymerase subunit RPC12/RpoP
VTIGGRSETAPGYVEQAGTAPKVRCPSCGDSRPRRLERKGFMQQRVLPLLGYYPWVCGACKSTFLMRKRYRRKTKKKDYVDAP